MSILLGISLPNGSTDNIPAIYHTHTALIPRGEPLGLTHAYPGVINAGGPGDAMDLAVFPAQAFQVVSAINLIDRLSRPRAFLRQLPRLVVPGGQLLIATPFTWLPEYTRPREWLTDKQLRELLWPDFQLTRHGHVPFVIREHRRKFQLAVAEVFTFIRHLHQSSPLS